MEPGIYRSLSNAAYHGGPGVSKSLLDLIAKSPAHLRAAQLTPPDERKPTPAQALGTAAHTAILEPGEMPERYAAPFVAPAGALHTMDDMRAALEQAGIAFKSSAKRADLEALTRTHLPDRPIAADLRAAHEAAAAGKIILEPDTHAQLDGMRGAVQAHKAARNLLAAPGFAEMSAYWYEPVIDTRTGEVMRDGDGKPVLKLCRVRPDYWRKDGIIVDLKTTHSGGAAPTEFARSVENFRYFVQAFMYLCGARKALEAAQRGPDAEFFADFAPPKAFVFIAVEVDACVVAGEPKGVATYTLTAEDLDAGEVAFRRALELLHQCEAAGRFPGYSEKIESLAMRPWARAPYLTLSNEAA